METRLFSLDDYKNTGRISDSDAALIKEAASIIKGGGLAAFPTETVYGLGGNALEPGSSRRIYEAKGRPSDNPLIVHICDTAMLKELVTVVPDYAKILMESFWPGPMTLIFRKSELIPEETTGGLDTVAVRFPSHPVAAALIKEAALPIAAPSANRSGRPSTTTAEHCMEDLGGRVEAILDGGSCDIGLESTIIDVTGDVPVLLRPGAVTKEMISSVLHLSKVPEDAAIRGPLAAGVRPRAPGMKYRHYAPKAPMVLVCAGKKPDISGISGRSMSDMDTLPDYKRIAAGIKQLIKEREQDYRHISVLCSAECLEELFGGRTAGDGYNTGGDAAMGHGFAGGAAAADDSESEAPGTCTISIKLTGSRKEPRAIAHDIFEKLREFDTDGTEFIIAEGYSEKELGLALMNRLKKAAAWQIIYV